MKISSSPTRTAVEQPPEHSRRDATSQGGTSQTAADSVPRPRVDLLPAELVTAVVDPLSLNELPSVARANRALKAAASDRLDRARAAVQAIRRPIPVPVDERDAGRTQSAAGSPRPGTRTRKVSARALDASARHSSLPKPGHRSGRAGLSEPRRARRRLSSGPPPCPVATAEPARLQRTPGPQ